MSGKIVGGAILLAALIAGAALYYLQIYGFYRSVDAVEVALVAQSDAGRRAIDARAVEAIDADSSPIRFRACFETEADPATLAEEFVTLDLPTPRNAPPWFSCFDAEAIAEALGTGQAQAFLGAKNIHFGVDQIVVIAADGRGYIWHELNDCGEKAYDGTIVGEDCPERVEN